MRIFLLRLLVVAALLLIWELGADRLVSAFFISRPSAIALKFWIILGDGSLARNMAITAYEAILGFIAGGIAGALVGLALGRSETLGMIFDPFITAFYSLPKVALAPLFILWFGIGLEMKVLFAAAIVFFLVFLNTYTGVRSVSRELITVFRLIGARERHLVRMVVIPSAITWIFAGLRLSVPYALIGAIVGEIMAANSGLGYLVENAAAQFDTASVFAALIGVMILAMALNYLVRLLERRLMPWHQEDDRTRMAV